MRTTESLLKGHLGPNFRLQDEGVPSWSMCLGAVFPPLYTLLTFFWKPLTCSFKVTLSLSFLLPFHQLQAVLISEKFSSTRTVSSELSPTAKSEVQLHSGTRMGVQSWWFESPEISETRLNCKCFLRRGLCPGLFLWLKTVQMSWLC